MPTRRETTFDVPIIRFPSIHTEVVRQFKRKFHCEFILHRQNCCGKFVKLTYSCFRLTIFQPDTPSFHRFALIKTTLYLYADKHRLTPVIIGHL